MTERRFERVPLRVPLFITIGGGRLYEKAVSIESSDISGGGLCFETRSKIPIEARSKIVMGSLGDLPASSLIEGRIAYRRTGEDSDRYIVGVEFVEFVNTTREEILERIDVWSEDAGAGPPQGENVD